MTHPGRTAPGRYGRPFHPARTSPCTSPHSAPTRCGWRGELADAWYPFLLPRSGLADGIKVLHEGAMNADRAVPLISPGLPVAVAADHATARTTASWWVATYLLGMGPTYARSLRRHGLGDAVDAVLAANPTRRTTEVPATAEVLLDELTVWGDAEDLARSSLDSWFEAGAEMPVVVLPPGRPVAELEYALEALRPSPRPAPKAV